MIGAIQRHFLGQPELSGGYLFARLLSLLHKYST